MIEKYKDKIEYSGKFPVRCEIDNFPNVVFHVCMKTNQQLSW